ncbi:MAG: hypothetical protein U0R50_12405 [Gaiellales bacterium]
MGVATGVAIAVAGVFVFGPNRDAAPEKFTNEPVQIVKQEAKAPFSPEARQVAMRFVQTAVARQSLEEAWELSGPTVRGGLTRKQWLTGNIPVVPYPLEKLEVAPFKVDASYKSSALIEIALLPRKNAGIRAQIFFMELKKVGKGKSAHWVVDNWVPRGGAVTPR